MQRILFSRNTANPGYFYLNFFNHLENKFAKELLLS